MNTVNTIVKTTDANVEDNTPSWIEISLKAKNSALNGIWDSAFIDKIGLIDETPDDSQNELKNDAWNVIINADKQAEINPEIAKPENTRSDDVQNLRIEYKPVLGRLIKLVEAEDEKHIHDDIDHVTGEDKRDLFTKLMPFLV